MVIDVFLPLLLVIALIWVVKNAAEDVMHASKGQNSPRREFWDKRWAAREKRTGKPRPKATGFWSKGPLRRYLFDSWADAWANANTKRAQLRRLRRGPLLRPRRHAHRGARGRGRRGADHL
ncbi:hypothetical protein DRA43_28555, partial [Micromonospora provocatoris]